MAVFLPVRLPTPPINISDNMVDENLKKLVEYYEVGDLLHRAILVVDDDVPNLDVLSGLLESDYKVFQADSGARALEIIGDTPLDVIISDQRMPEMNGVELLERAGRSHPDVAGIVLTAYTDSPAIIEAINRAGAFRFLTKPWDADDIRMAVAQASAHVYQRRAIVRLVDLLSVRNEELGLALQDLKSAQDRMLHLERVGTIGRLTSGVIHDIRNFLMGLILLEEEFSDKDISDDFKETVKVSLAGLRNLLASMEAMRQYAQGGTIDLSMKTVSPGDILRDAMTVAHMDIEFRRRKVDLRITDTLPEIAVDRQRLVQAMVNLIRNAVQATEPGQGIVIEATLDAEGNTRLAVEDEGKGVPPGMIDDLFEPFSSSKGEEGMGMGLYMARLTVESHGGTIEYKSCQEGGTRFEITLGAGGGPAIARWIYGSHYQNNRSERKFNS